MWCLGISPSTLRRDTKESTEHKDGAPNISKAEVALDSQAGRLKIASKVTAKGTCIDRPTVATVGPACVQGRQLLTS